jgi:protein-S-isoprenylcysteine O-methyltransferase Ste14
LVSQRNFVGYRDGMFLHLILYCWDIFALFWLINLFSNKRTVERQSPASRLLYLVPFLTAFWLQFGGFFRHRYSALQLEVVPHSRVLDIICLGLTVLGLGFAIWARVTLGRNWSGTVTFKENHELIERGPYALVRHPIYTAMLLMFLGTALAVGRAGGLLGFALLLLSFWIKFRQEEKVMIAHFGDRYLAYRQRVRAIVPFVL